jgi:hypothetical protein
MIDCHQNDLWRSSSHHSTTSIYFFQTDSHVILTQVQYTDVLLYSIVQHCTANLMGHMHAAAHVEPVP